MKLKTVPFAKRRPLLEDHVFFVPIYYKGYEEYALPDLAVHFGNEHPICVEFCSGNGDWIIERAKLYPETNWIAVEKRFDRVQKIWSKLKRHHLSNLLVVCGEAFTFTHYYLLSNRIEGVYINFPDPWPKMKHTKHRLMQPTFLDELSRVLMQGKKVTFVTDDFAYLKKTVTLLLSHPHFSPSFPPPFYRIDIQNYGCSWFENLWKEKGKDIHTIEFIHRVLDETPN